MFQRLWQGAKNLLFQTSEQKSSSAEPLRSQDAPPSVKQGALLDVIRKLGLLTAEELTERPATDKTNRSLGNDKKLENLDINATLNPTAASGSFSHVMLLAQKKGKEDLWFVKWIFQADDPNVNRDLAERETAANEYLRLLMPWQPKTRTLIDNDGEVCVMSKGIKGFIPCKKKHIT